MPRSSSAFTSVASVYRAGGVVVLARKKENQQISIGTQLAQAKRTLSRLEFGQGSQVNVPIGILLWLMIYPMMLKVDFSAVGGIARRPTGRANRHDGIRRFRRPALQSRGTAARGCGARTAAPPRSSGGLPSLV